MIISEMLLKKEISNTGLQLEMGWVSSQVVFLFKRCHHWMKAWVDRGRWWDLRQIGSIWKYQRLPRSVHILVKPSSI